MEASTSRAISSRCSSMASRSSSVASGSTAQLSAIRSETSKPAGLAGLLDHPDHLAGQARAAQLRGQLEVERDRLALLVDHRPALARPLGDDHLVGQHLDGLAVEVDAGPAVGLQRGGQGAGVGGGDRGGDAGRVLGEALAERAEVALGAVVDQVGPGRGERLDRADVELLGDLARAAPRTAGRTPTSPPAPGAAADGSSPWRRPAPPGRARPAGGRAASATISDVVDQAPVDARARRPGAPTRAARRRCSRTCPATPAR